MAKKRKSPNGHNPPPSSPPRAKPPHASFLDALKSAWRTVARPEQLAPEGDWSTWVFCGGRGAGKTRSGAEWVLERVEQGIARYIHLVAPTAADVRDVMVEGPAGIMSVAASHLRPVYQPSLRKLVFPNGAVALLFSADDPNRLRGPQCDTIWVDELCAMRTAQQILENADFGRRLGKNPQMLVTTTPRPLKCFRALLAREGQDVVVTRSSSYANRENLAPSFFHSIVAKYAGTRLHAQEIEAQLLTDVPGALWHLDRIDELRVTRAPQPFERVVIGIDPATTFGPDSDETGIIVAGLSDGHAYILDDLSGRYPPEEWARRAVLAYRTYSADRIVAEVNQGGALVESTLRAVDPAIPVRTVHAARGKLTRAEPVSALYERGLCHHLGVFGPLEDQMTSYDGSRTGSSPDRLDALCWAIHELKLGEPPGQFIRESAFLAPAIVEGDAPAPVEMPQRVNTVVAHVVAGLGLEPDALGVVYFGVSVWNSMNAPVVVLDWDLVEIDEATLEHWLPAVYARLDELATQTRALNGLLHSGVTVDPENIGSVLLDGAIGRSYVVGQLPEDIVKRTPVQRAISASSLLSARKVRLVREAHEKTTIYKGVNQNHFVGQVTRFGVGQSPDQVGPLLAALANGVLEIYADPNMRLREAAA